MAKKCNQIGFIGEYSTPANPGGDRRWLFALKNVQDYFYQNCLANTYWAAGECFTKEQSYVISKSGWPSEAGERGDRPQLRLLRKYIALSKKTKNSSVEWILKHIGRNDIN